MAVSQLPSATSGGHSAQCPGRCLLCSNEPCLLVGSCPCQAVLLSLFIPLHPRYLPPPSADTARQVLASSGARIGIRFDPRSPALGSDLEGTRAQSPWGSWSAARSSMLLEGPGGSHCPEATQGPWVLLGQLPDRGHLGVKQSGLSPPLLKALGQLAEWLGATLAILAPALGITCVPGWVAGTCLLPALPHPCFHRQA